MDKSEITIVVPVYKKEINCFESVSLRQLFSILSSYDICFVCPDSLDLDYKELEGKRYQVQHFSDDFFYDTEEYSRLCLSDEFYERFTRYRYLLIYQLDAFVFYDGLLEFCLLDYDYIGATTKHDWTKKCVVGNGGLSLRKVSAVRRLLKEKNNIMNTSGYRKLFERREDNFFSYCGDASNIDFSVPSCKEALKFAVQRDHFHGIRNIKQQGLPFGIHYFPSLNYSFWKPVIESYGYVLPDEENVNSNEELRYERFIRYDYYFRAMVSTLPYKMKLSMIRDLGLNISKDYIIWGYGKLGKTIIRILVGLGIRISAVFDENRNYMSNCLNDIPCIIPDIKLISKDNMLIIATKRYEEEILERLMHEYGVDSSLYVSFSDIWVRLNVCKRIYCQCFPYIPGITHDFSAQ